MRRAFLAAAAGLAVAAASTDAARPPTTTERVVGGDTEAPYSTLAHRPGFKRVVRADLAAPRPGRARRRTSLLYFAQLSDFQLADEESPARVETLDEDNTPFTSAWRPQEALEPFTVDMAIRQVNRFARRSPVPMGKRRRARLALSILTGDNADNQQRNEITWVRQLLEGGRIDPNSGVESSAPCAAGPIEPGEAARYTGVQDYDDTGRSARFYDPDEPFGAYEAFPAWPGLMDRAQQPFVARGLTVPSYVSLGNHDGTVQGNAWANSAFDSIATGCVKPLTFGGLEPPQLIAALGGGIAVPPDPAREFVSRAEYMRVTGAGVQPDDHGFAYVGRAERAASGGHATHYTFRRGRVRFVSINTVGEGSSVNPEGNLDDPQFRWVERVLRRADARRELVVVFGHHPIRTMTNTTPDENAPSCEGSADPGCDGDPRSSEPIRTGADLRALLLEHPSVIAYVAGHTHEHEITPFPREGGGGFWGIETSSEIDWPIHSRLLEITDNRDGTLSIFGTLIDHGAPLKTPETGTAAERLRPPTLAAIAREIAFNDPQQGGSTGLGDPEDRNVELLVDDPRR